MNKAKAKFLAREMRKLFKNEPVVFVDCYEKFRFLPQIQVGVFIEKIEVASTGGEDALLNFSVNGRVFTHLDNPAIESNFRTLVFRCRSSSGQEIIRSVTLMRDYKDEEEEQLWTKLKYNLL